WTFHHVLLDGWSVSHVFSDLFACHAALEGRHAPALPARRPFRDYLAWLARQDHAQAQAHWQGVLQGFESPTPLPYDRPPVSAHTSQSSASLPFELDQADSRRLLAVAKAHRLTMNTLVQGAWALLLARYSRHSDVCFGTTVSGR